jgi:hypothetical protein
MDGFPGPEPALARVTSLKKGRKTKMAAQLPRSAAPSPRPSRRVKPEVAAKWAAQRRESEIENLYQTPVEKLSPDDLARMKAAFFRG